MVHTRKILGFILLFLGLFIIFYSLYSSYSIFTAKAEAPEIFQIEEKVALDQKTLDLQSQMEEMIGEQLKGLLPQNSIPHLLNLIAWSILAGILLFGGAQVASLGIRLIK